MRTNSTKKIKIKHELAEVSIGLLQEVDESALQRLIINALNQYQEEQVFSASLVMQDTIEELADYYLTPGFHLKNYRKSFDLTQKQLAEKANIKQHHVSEMESNKRAIGKKLAMKLAKILDCDYRRFL